MITPEIFREKALAFLVEEGIERAFIEHVSITSNDANVLINIVLEHKPNPDKILEIGTFVGVSSAVLGLSIPQAHLVCIDPDLPTKAHVCLGAGELYTSNKRTNLNFLKKLINHLGIAERFTLYRGFFSCYPNEECQVKLARYGIEVQSYEIVGKRICEQYGSFEVVFLDADHRKAAVYSDLTLLYPHLTPGGIIILHDIGSGYWGEQVLSGTRDFLEQYPDITLHIQGEFGVIRKVASKEIA